MVAAVFVIIVFFFQAEDGIRDGTVTGVQTCALPISTRRRCAAGGVGWLVGGRRDRAPRAWIVGRSRARGRDGVRGLRLAQAAPPSGWRAARRRSPRVLRLTSGASA